VRTVLAARLARCDEQNTRTFGALLAVTDLAGLDDLIIIEDSVLVEVGPPRDSDSAALTRVGLRERDELCRLSVALGR
jgi:hypothetical protein